MRALSLFSGGGGLDLAAEMAGIDIVGQVEYEPACIKVLERHWPDTARWEDVKNVRGTDVIARCGHIDIIFGGFPCQPHSVAGKRKASSDERDLWPEYARLIREIKPRWVVGENVPGLLTSEDGRFFGAILRDLAEMGYDAGWGVWGAADVGAPHKRDRVFIVAYADNIAGLEADSPISAVRSERHARDNAGGRCVRNRGEHVGNPCRAGQQERNTSTIADKSGHFTWKCACEHVADTEGVCLQGQYNRPRKIQSWRSGGRRTQPRLGRNPDGRTDRLDAPRWPAGRGAEQYDWEPPRVVPAGQNKERVARIKMLGNMVVPWQALPLFQEIMEVHHWGA